MAVDDALGVGEATEGLEDIRVGFVTAQAQPRCDVQRKLMATMRYAARSRPAKSLKHLECAEILDQPIGKCRIELEHIPVRAHAAVADEVACVLMGKEVLPCRQRMVIGSAQLRLKLEVERITSLFIPAQFVWRERLSVGKSLVEVKPSVGIDRHAVAVAGDLDDRFDPAKIFVKRCSANLELDRVIAQV